MQTTNRNKLSRRQFLGQSACAALGTGGLISTLLNTRMMGQVAAGSGPTDYRALVCIFLLGGNDSYNMLVPYDSQAAGSLYDGYVKTRGLAANGGLALPWGDISPLAPGGVALPYGIHNRLNKLRQHFNSGDLAFVSNVGTLIRPTTSSDLESAASSFLPIGAFSHSDQQEQWQTCFKTGRSATGWGGLMVDSMYGGNIPWASNISVGGVNIWQTGNSSVPGASQPFSVSNGGVSLIDGPTSNNLDYETLYTGAINSMFGATLESQRPGILERVLHRKIQKSNEQADELSSILATSNADDATVQSIFDNDATLADNPLAGDLRTAARFIALRNQFSFNGGPKRQTFFIGLGGWDHHDEVLNNQDYLFQVVDNAVDAFYSALQAINMQSSVTTFSASDFGRTLSSNGRGSDHGWGGHCFVLGGRVDGGKIHGTYPNLATTELTSAGLDAGRQRIIPTNSVDEYFATLARWFGITDPTTLEEIFPNLPNFSDNLNFMKPG